MPDPAAPRRMHLEIPAQRAKPIEVDDTVYDVSMPQDWGVAYWLEGQYDEGHGG